MCLTNAPLLTLILLNTCNSELGCISSSGSLPFWNAVIFVTTPRRNQSSFSDMFYLRGVDSLSQQSHCKQKTSNLSLWVPLSSHCWLTNPSSLEFSKNPDHHCHLPPICHTCPSLSPLFPLFTIYTVSSWSHYNCQVRAVKVRLYSSFIQYWYKEANWASQFWV